MIVVNKSGWNGTYEITLDGGELCTLKGALESALITSIDNGMETKDEKLRRYYAMEEKSYQSMRDGINEALRQAVKHDRSVVSFEVE